MNKNDEEPLQLSSKKLNKKQSSKRASDASRISRDSNKNGIL